LPSPFWGRGSLRRAQRTTATTRELRFRAVLTSAGEAAALAALPAAHRDLSVLRDRAVLAVDLRGDPGAEHADFSALSRLALVLVALTDDDTQGAPGALEPFDVVVRSTDELSELVAAVERNPQASVTL